MFKSGPFGSQHRFLEAFDISKIRSMASHAKDEIKMKIAVPLFGDRISPHFGASSEILLVETQGQKVTKKITISIDADDPGQMARRLVTYGVDRIVCGGIQRNHKQWLIDKGIQVMDNHKGPAEKLVFKLIASEPLQGGG
jgi:predicted Fe-Mo cluster-binding NifX family protein